MTVKDDLVAIAGVSNVSDDPQALVRYSKDLSFVEPSMPGWVVFPENTAQVQEIVRLAAGRKIPVTPRSSSISFHGAGIPSPGGVVIDLTGMKKILKIDPEDKRVQVEAGVSYGQLQPVLAEKGLQVCNPLWVHPLKSVLTSSLEREPILVPKPEYTETLCTFEIVIGNGECIRTGSALGKGITSGIYPDGLYPGSALYKGAQGTLGIVTWANIKVEWLPQLDRTVLIGFNEPEEIPEPLYAIQRRQMGRECFVLNRLNLAAALAPGEKADILALSKSLPEYLLIICLSGGELLPEEKIEYEEEALTQVIAEMDLQVCKDVEKLDVSLDAIPAMLRRPWDHDKVFWKQRHKGGFHDIFFYTPIEKAPYFCRMMSELARDHSYDPSHIGFYLQPLEYGRVAFCQFTLHCDPSDSAEVEQVRSLFALASRKAMDMGGFFSCPYGLWAEMVYQQADKVYPETLKLVKKAFDPEGIMNPGRLCF